MATRSGALTTRVFFVTAWLLAAPSSGFAPPAPRPSRRRCPTQQTLLRNPRPTSRAAAAAAAARPPPHISSLVRRATAETGQHDSSEQETTEQVVNNGDNEETGNASSEEDDDDARVLAECERYLAEVGDAFEETCVALDACIAEARGTVPTAEAARELVARGGVGVVRHFRGMTAAELAPRWREVDKRRATLKATGEWDALGDEDNDVAPTKLPTDVIKGALAKGKDAEGVSARVVAWRVSQEAPSLRVAGARETRRVSSVLRDVLTEEYVPIERKARHDFLRAELAKQGRDVAWLRETYNFRDDASDEDVLDAYDLSTVTSKAVENIIGFGVGLVVLFFIVTKGFDFLLDALGGGPGATTTTYSAPSTPGTLDSTMDLLMRRTSS